jgi:hypothetical protein
LTLAGESALAMTRYFFDFVGSARSQYDYHGRVFKTLEHACGFAELIALDFGIDSEPEWVSVQVRSARGELFYSVAVQPV